MKTNKGLIVGLAAAGVAIAGTVVFLATTKTGKRAMKRWNIKGKKFAEGVDVIIKEAKKKIKDLKEEIAAEYKVDDSAKVYE